MTELAAEPMQPAMTTLSTLSPQALRRAATIKEKIERLEGELNRLLGGSASSGVVRAASDGPKRKVSAATRAKIAARVKASWAKRKADSKK
ncbi:MAG: hypothetical protein IT381_01540 [Deltaproteobacteria bacterium]|nr:hypothetical protein [Deltaproteobacteria bacterium]